MLEINEGLVLDATVEITYVSLLDYVITTSDCRT